MNGPLLPFRVLTVRYDGRERLYQAYATREQAQSVADALARVRCPTRVAGPDEIDLGAVDDQPQPGQ